MTGFAKMPNRIKTEKELPEEIKKTTNLKKLVKLAHNSAYFFKDPDNRAYAKIKKGEHREELYPLKSSSFEDWLSAINFKVSDEVATSKLKSEAIEFLEGETNLSGKTHEVGLRAMGDEEYIEIDLGDEDLRSVYITKYNWRVRKHKNYFYRNKFMKSLPVPSRDKLDKDWAGNIFNISGNSQSMLILGWPCASRM